MSKKFAVTGVAGFIAPRHLKAIKETENRLVAAMDPHDSVGILDNFEYNVSFFKEFERFDRYCEKLRRKSDADKIDYVSICSPNHLHDAHVRFALRIGADAICEKPLVLNPWNLDALQELEQENGKRVYTVLQLRVHPALVKLKQDIEKQTSLKKHEVCLTYITSRGPWYMISWKGNVEQSGGLATNIGIHFFDLLIWLFGGVEHTEIHFSDAKRVAGYLELKMAKVKWLLSINKDDLPAQAVAQKKTTFRSITINEKEVEFSQGFADLHTMVYREILAGRGFGIEDAKPSIGLAHDIRTAVPIGRNQNSHPFLK